MKPIWLLLALFTIGCSERGSGGGDPSEVGGSAGSTTGSGAGTSAAGGQAGAGAGSAGLGGAHDGGAGGAAGGTTSGGAGGAGGGGVEPGLRDYLLDPAFPDTFWETASLQESGIDPEPIDQALDRIAAEGWEIHSFLIARNGRLVLEQYGWDSGQLPVDPARAAHQVLPDERHALFSTTKSVLSALVGIAMEEGFITTLDQPIADWFSDYASLNPSPEKSLITFEDLLTMRSGLEWSEGDQSTFEAPDPARAMLSRPVVDLPVGEVWNYSSGGSDIVAEILRTATGATPLAYASEKLFGPIGIDDPPWTAGQNGTHHGGWGLSLTSREMARFGELFRNRGAWDEEQIVPAAWTDASTTPRCATPWGMQYAYHWWVPNLQGFFSTIGAFGQQIFVSREHRLVIVFTAHLPSEQANSIYEELLRTYVLPALVD